MNTQSIPSERNQNEQRMGNEPKIAGELEKMRQQYEPLLPVEKKLIAWSLGLGLSLLGIFYFLSKLLPDAHRPL